MSNSFVDRLQAHIGRLVRVSVSDSSDSKVASSIRSKVGLVLGATPFVAYPSNDSAWAVLLIDGKVECYDFFAKEIEFLGEEDD